MIKKQIALFTTSFPRHQNDDAGRFIYHLVHAYSSRGISGYVFVPQDSNEPTEEIVGNFVVRRFKYGIFTKGRLAFGSGGIMPTLRRSPLLAFQIPGLLFGFFRKAFQARRAIDLIHVQWAQNALSAFFLFKPYIITLRGEDLKLLRNPLIRFLFAPILRRSALLVTVGESVRKELLQRCRFIPEKKVVVIPNGVALPSVSESERAELVERFHLPKAECLLTVGSVIPRKGHAFLIQALAEQALSLTHLIIAGRGEDQEYLKKLNSLAASLQVEDRVHFVGGCSPLEIAALLKSVDLYVSASDFEGRPNAVLEAIAASLPVLLSDIEAHRELTSNEESLYKQGDQKDFASKVVALRDRKLRASALSSQNAIIRDLSWERCAELYDEAISLETPSTLIP